MNRFKGANDMRMGVVCATLATLVGCSSGTGTTGSSQHNQSGGGHGGNGGTAGAGGHAGSGGGVGGTAGGPTVPTCGEGTVLAINRIYFGDVDWDNTPNATNGWKQYGRNIDKLVSAKDSLDLCKPIAGATAAAVYPDGNDGIDNSFGKNLLPIVFGFNASSPKDTNDAIRSGDFTYLLTIRGPNEPMSCPPSALFGGLRLGSTPLFNGSDQWPLDPAYFADPQDGSSVKNVFLGTTINNGVFRSGPEAAMTVEIRFNTLALRFPIQHVQIEMLLDAGQTSAEMGQISGIIDPETLTQEVARVLQTSDKAFCDPNSPTLASVLKQLRQSADIMIDGTQDPTQECNGISIGLGFTMKSAKLGAVGNAVQALPDPCNP